jgi:hypothetical protein
MNIQTFNHKIKQIEFNIETSLIDLIESRCKGVITNGIDINSITNNVKNIIKSIKIKIERNTCKGEICRVREDGDTQNNIYIIIQAKFNNKYNSGTFAGIAGSKYNCEIEFIFIICKPNNKSTKDKLENITNLIYNKQLDKIEKMFIEDN